MTSERLRSYSTVVVGAAATAMGVLGGPRLRCISLTPAVLLFSARKHRENSREGSHDVFAIQRLVSYYE